MFNRRQVNIMLLFYLLVFQALCGTYCNYTRPLSRITKTSKIVCKTTITCYIYRLKIKGEENIKKIGKQIKYDLHSDITITRLLRSACKDYQNMLQSYYEFASNVGSDLFLDTHYSYIDLIDASHHLLATELTWLLKKMAMNTNLYNNNENILDVHNNITKALANEKGKEMKYLCEEHKICRPYPAFTDYAADLLAVILKLSDSKLTKLVEIVTKVSQRYYTFLLRLTGEEDSELILTILQNASVCVKTVREKLNSLMLTLSKKFKIIFNGNDDAIMKSKLQKILMDIIDKALTSDPRFVAVHFYRTILEMQGWAVGLRPRIDDICQEFASTWVKMLTLNTTESALKEMKVLIRALLRGFETSDKLLPYLFQYGSDYVGHNLPGQERNHVYRIGIKQH